ncbi:Alkyl sulfatase BDS1, metallo-beta-lactamase superfamily [Saccharopolyspora kobensis]|uniref:Alkyl sulfatase BDS1, metallo-beta-lactamase superfamily n=1 Tax=Saccharopolyspora kobensis TaxID=146035 RepID=A0A1H6ELC5_9PSEU|nr:alkyl sulfatase dimerization domain-containing protein [Saccharopolyspora kobensis]SEG97901.1 Alkyl sulfatase BDS1, metallo-beta-lactamase superfamily [Saccharopolyspora kobensis]SFF23784.1 Alkyl sulfatase BDS1, metallo-beta-lactamase superfamily [Saccharopolyspora kobensis]
MGEPVTELPFADRSDFEDADRGFIAALEPGVVADESGRVVWDDDAYAFLRGDCPPTVHPSLWRQSQLCAEQGLYEVVPGIYQVRGLDLSNMTLVEGERGVIVIDPLISVETAAAGLALYRAHRGDRPVTAVIYTHSHVDHFGGVEGVVSGEVPILAPVGFMEHAVAENVYAGTAMTRRGNYMYGALLEKGPRGQIGTGLGQGISVGRVSLLPPTLDITRTGQREVVDGVPIRFQLTPGTEAPAEMNFHFPDHRALCMAENATHTMHNVLTLRGAEVRDARNWARYLTEAIAEFGDDTDVAFASHHWPTWGRDRVVKHLTEQRDLYAYLHDQTLRRINLGWTGTEIAERFELPPALEAAWHARGYYGSVSHNVKAIYQRYMGWYDGNPSSLWEHPPEEAAKRYVDCIGGVDRVVAKAAEYAAAGDLRFAAQLLKHAVFAEPDHTAAGDLLADVYQRLGFGAENATWRNSYLTGAQELRRGITPMEISISGAILAALTVEQLLDSVAIRVDGPRAAAANLAIDWHVTDTDDHVRTTLSNGALVQEPIRDSRPPDLTLTLTKQQLLALLAGDDPEGIDHRGDRAALTTLQDLLDDPDPNFPIVRP